MKRIFYGYWILTVCFLCLFVQAGMVMYPFSLYVGPLTDEFGWTRTGIMIAASLRTLCIGAFSPIVGKVVIRYGARRIIAFGAVLIGIGLLLLSTVREIWQFYILYSIVGAGTSFMGVVPATTVVSNWFKKRRGFAIGILGGGIGVGAVLLPLVIGAILIPEFGWRSSYVVSGLLVISTITPLSILIIRQKPEDMGLLPDGISRNDSLDVDTKPGPISEAGLSLMQALKTKSFWLMAVAFFTICTANQALMQNHVPHLSDLSYAPRVTALALSIVGIGSGIGKFVFGWLCDFIRPKYTLAIGSVFGISSVVILMNITSTSSALMIGAYTLMLGLCVGSWLPAMSMNVSKTFGLASYGVIFGAISLMFTFGGALGPTIAGIIYDSDQSYSLAFIMSMVLYIITIPAILLVSPINNKSNL